MKLLAITDIEAAEYSRLPATLVWNGRQDLPVDPKRRSLVEVFESPCVFARKEYRSKENLVTSREWGFVYVRRPSTVIEAGSVGSIVVLVSADEFGFEKMSPDIFRTADFRKELSDARIATFARMDQVADCNPRVDPVVSRQ